MRVVNYSVAYLLCTLMFMACAIKGNFYKSQTTSYTASEDDDIYHAIYFLGGSDEVKVGGSTIGVHLEAQTRASGKNSTLLLLGNNSLRNTSYRNDSSQRALENMELLRLRYEFFNNLKGKYYAVLGPHEWANGNRRGKDDVRVLEEIIEEELNQGNIIRPAMGCPGPEEIEIGEHIMLLLIDTQWLFHSWDKPKGESGCDAESNLDFFVNLDDAIKRHYDKKIIVAGYHSLVSSGRHAGYFPAKSHFVPLPVLGSIRVGYRSWLGRPNDLTNPIYKTFITTMTDLLKQHENIIYMSSHEKTLEYHKQGSIHYLNSGSYSKGLEVSQKNAEYASSDRGYGRILFKNDGKCVVEYWGDNEGTATLLFQQELFADWSKKPEEKGLPMDQLDYSDSVKTTYASHLYTKKAKRPGMLGNNYRQEWVEEVSGIPYFDIGNEMGGFKILKRGGGQQTKSLRLENVNKKQYVLRSVEKYPESAVPADLRNTVAVDIVTDQISAAHPYGAFAVPKMAEAAGIYHTNPKLFYLPDDPRLGIYRHSFANGLYLFEERPAKNREDIASFGRSKDIVNTFEVLEETRKDGDHYVDQEFVLRSRLFDIFIGDWDRHDDQWRWASFRDEEGNKYYRPIPRDRDQAFFWSDGWLLNIASRNWGVAKFQGFHDKIRDVDGLSFNARYFDRSFMNAPEREVWVKTAEDLQRRLTDEIIENAINDLPPEIYKLHGEHIIRKLKNRRNDLQVYANDYYVFLAKEVDVFGSNKKEHFIVERLNDEQIKVTVHLLKSKSGEVKRTMYERTFLRSETKEIRLYGYGGDDKFDISGDVSKSILVRVIGGKGDDVIEDRSSVNSIKKQTLVYDKKSKTTITSAGEVKDRTSNRDPLVNDYNRKQFQYNVTQPILYPGFNPDDGIYIGGGVMITTHGFRKNPYKNRHIIRANIAPKSRSYDLSYSGTFNEAIGKWDFIINADIFAPSYTDYFYGYGNETPFDQEKFDNDIRYYGARYLQYIIYPEIRHRSKNELHELRIGGGYQTVNVKSSLNDLNQEQERFIITYARSLEYQLLDVRRHYLALYGRYHFDKTDNKFMPKRGFRWNAFLIGLEDVDDKEIDVNYQRFSSDLSYYYTFGRFLKTTIALRVGGTYTNGEFEFYQSAKLGGTNNFRGVRKFRFQGQHLFYQNTDIRFKLFNIRNPILPTTVGLVLFHDFGRVWVDDDPSTETGTSDKMHRGYGAGIWLAPMNAVSIGLDYSTSTLDERAIYLRMGFFF